MTLFCITEGTPLAFRALCSIGFDRPNAPATFLGANIIEFIIRLREVWNNFPRFTSEKMSQKAKQMRCIFSLKINFKVMKIVYFE
jgi:hypothetical protein